MNFTRAHSACFSIEVESRPCCETTGDEPPNTLPAWLTVARRRECHDALTPMSIWLVRWFEPLIRADGTRDIVTTVGDCTSSWFLCQSSPDRRQFGARFVGGAFELARPAIPVAAVVGVAFDLVQDGVNPRRGGISLVWLDQAMRGVPLPLEG